MTMFATPPDVDADATDESPAEPDAFGPRGDTVTTIDHTFKILVTGPFAAGKTSLIQSVSQTAVVSTDVVTSGDESEVKGETTVAMDFGTFQLPDEGVRLLLFGTPGQPRFRFMTNILKGDVDIVAFVIDAQARHTHAAAVTRRARQGRVGPPPPASCRAGGLPAAGASRRCRAWP